MAINKGKVLALDQEWELKTRDGVLCLISHDNKKHPWLVLTIDENGLQLSKGVSPDAVTFPVVNGRIKVAK